MKYKYFPLTCIILLVLTATISASRLPTVDGDNETWGTVLNDYLTTLSGLNATKLNLTMVNGTNIYSSSINTTHIIDATISSDDLGTSSVADDEIDYTAVTLDDFTNDANYLDKDEGGTIDGNIIINGNFSLIGDYINTTVTNQYLNGSFFPDITNLFNLGSALLRWGNIFANNIFLSGNLNVSSIYATDWSNVTINESQVSDADWWDTSSDVEDDEIAEGKIGFSTSCGAGNHLYIDGNDLGCEADATGGNSSFNQSLTDSIYAGIEWDYNQTTATYNSYNNAWSSTYNSTYDAKISYNSTFNQSLTDSLYASIDAGEGNSSWNQTHANTLYAPNTTAGIQSLINSTGVYSTYNATYDSNQANNSWNQSNADTIYVPYDGATQNVNLGNNNFSVGGSDLFVDTSTNDKVGIGTAFPQARLHIQVDAGGSNLPTMFGSDIILEDTSGASDTAIFSMVGGASGESIIRFGDTDDENPGEISYKHGEDTFNFTVGASANVMALDSSGNLLLTGNITADYFIGNGSQLTGVSGGNDTWNESYANTKYAPNTTAGIQELINSTGVYSTYNSTYHNYVVANQSNSTTWWASLTNWLSGWFVNNAGTLEFNETKLNNTIFSEGVRLGFNSTYNATYDAKASYQFTNNNFNGSGNFTTTGRVGIGTTTPTTKLEVNGTLNMSSNNITTVDCIVFKSGGKICDSP